MARTHKVQFDNSAKLYFARIQTGGVRKRFWLGDNKKAAIERAKQLDGKVAIGEINLESKLETQCTRSDGRRDIRLEELLHHHLEWVQVHRSAGTYKLRQAYLKRFLKFVGPCMVSKITRAVLEQYYTHAKTHFARSRSGGSEHLAHVKACLRWGEETELCDSFVRRFPKIRRSAPCSKRLTDADFNRLLLAMEHDLRDIVTFGVLTGLRPQELCGLQTKQLSCNQDGTRILVIEQHKTSASAHDPVPRSLPLSTAAAAIVDRQFDIHPKSNLVFLNAAGTSYTTRVFRRRLERASLRAGLDRKVTPYVLRHTFASMLADSGIGQIALSSLMGHTSLRTTSRYVRHSDEYSQAMLTRHADHVAKIANAPHASLDADAKTVGQRSA